jgi:hypothetical protein
LFDQPEWGKAAGDQWEDAIWFYGGKASGAFQNSSQRPRPEMESKGFKDSGIYIVRAEDIFVAVDVGPIGQNGKGGHAHNDSLSFELFASGQTWIQDPGTYVYTADYEARNLFRSTAFHNTFSMSGYEQNGYHSRTLFSLKNESMSHVLLWRSEPDSDVMLTCEVRRFRSPKAVHSRSFRLNRENRALLLTDTIHSPQSSAELLFHFAPGLTVEPVESPYPGLKLINADGKITWLFSIFPGGGPLELSEGWISESYGSRVRAWVASIKLPSIRDNKTVILLPGDPAISHRITDVLNAEDHTP